tara:strand:- start:266 stop:457 length:192 start_codon:yes stop_codon:yes gene_type:complete
MIVDPILAGLGIFVGIVVYQQFVIRNLQIDVDDIIADVDNVIDSHNNLVRAIVDLSNKDMIDK